MSLRLIFHQSILEIHLKVLVVGYGSIGKRHINNLALLSDVEILVCTKQKPDKFLIKNHCIVMDSLKKCLKENPDVAIIANVTNLHVKIAVTLAKAGVDLFIEKPLSNSIKGIKNLLTTVKKKKLITMMGCNLRFHPCIKKIKEMISKNDIGKIISAHVENGSYLPYWHPYEDYRDSYASREDLGGGVILTNIHELDYLYWFFSSVKEVFSFSGKLSDLHMSAEDFAAMVLQFKNNVVAEIHLDYFQRPTFRSCKIIGTKGTIYWDSETNRVKVYDIRKEKWIQKLKLENYDINSTYIAEMDHFLKCSKNRSRTINNIDDGNQTLKVALAAKRSAKIKKTVRLN